jgi:uncharacterized protein YqgC (DUF456 family)
MWQGNAVDLTDTGSLAVLLAAVMIVIGVLGVVIPILPGLLLCWGGVLVWAILGEGGWTKWVVLAFATIIAGSGVALKYLWPGRNMKRSGVPNRTLIVGGLLAIVGFFVIPLLGLFIGFIGGVYLSERMRLGTSQLAWPSTRSALKAAGLAMLIELATALLVTGTWLIGLVVT